MKNVRSQPCCATCGHVAVVTEYECGEDYYCNYENNRPPCGSFQMDEDFLDLADKEVPEYREYLWRVDDTPPPDDLTELHGAAWDRHIEAWRVWSIEHQVQPFYICDRFYPAEGAFDGT